MEYRINDNSVSLLISHKNLRRSINLDLTDLKFILLKFGKNIDCSYEDSKNRCEVVFYKNFETVIFRFERPHTSIDYCININKLIKIKNQLKDEKTG